QDETDPVDGEHVEEKQHGRGESAQAIELSTLRDGSFLPGLERNEFFLFLERMPDAERDHQPADRKSDPDDQRKYVRSDRLPRHGRQQPSAIGGERSKADENQPRGAIG